MSYSKLSVKVKDSNFRKFSEIEDLNRSCFMRDRDRIIHSTAFRKLKYKTQVFVFHEGDYYRTRLSHSIEVSQLARSISKIFKVNDDLSEAISLAHDLGHTPFGHAGEESLKEKLKENGSFNHNFHALKILTNLEKRYILFDGLNLTWETLDGILKHNGPITNKKKIPGFVHDLVNDFKGKFNINGSFEAQIASISDDIAYNNNDIDDGLHAQLFDLEELESLSIIKRNLKKIKFNGLKKSDDRIKHELVRLLIKNMIDDLVENTNNNILKLKPQCSLDVKLIKNPFVEFSDEMKNDENQLRLFLSNKMYNHPTVKTMTYKAKRIVSELFDLFFKENQLLPKRWKEFNNKKELLINISDYISSLTDKKAMNIHKKFFNLYDF